MMWSWHVQIEAATHWNSIAEMNFASRGWREIWMWDWVKSLV